MKGGVTGGKRIENKNVRVLSEGEREGSKTNPRCSIRIDVDYLDSHHEHPVEIIPFPLRLQTFTSWSQYLRTEEPSLVFKGSCNGTGVQKGK